jgi:hypothetical protein
MNDDNRLRQADWRFLLPISAPRTVLALTDGGVGPIGAEPGTTVVTRPRPNCDLAVATDPGKQALAVAFQSLRPGGVCYVESRSLLAGGQRALKRRVEAAGFAGVRLYWAWPWTTPSLWVPLDARAAATWVLSRRRGPVAVGAWRAARATGMLLPLCATAVRPPVDNSRGPHGVPLPALGGRPAWTLLAPGRHAINKVVALVSAADRPEPVLVLKLPRVEAAAAALAREAANLRAIEAARGERMAGVPRLLFEHQDDTNLRAIAESALDGRPLYRELEPARHAQLATQATDWLVALGRLRPLPSGRVESALDVVADVEALVTSRADRDLVAAARPAVARADNLERVFEQRDFSPWNVHLAPDGTLVVYDWESADPAGFPALDLVYFLAYTRFFLAGAMDSGRFSEAYRGMFSTNALAASCLERYCDALGIARERIPALRVLTWLVHARSAMRRPHTGPPQGLFLKLVRAELAGNEAAAAAM